MHQQPLTGLQRPAPFEGEVRSLVDDRETGGFGETHPLGNRVGAFCVGDAVLRVPAASAGGHNLVARGDMLHALAHGFDNTRHLAADRKRELRLGLVLALNLQDVEEIQSGRAVVDQHLTLARRRSRHIAEHHFLGARRKCITCQAFMVQSLRAGRVRVPCAR